MALPGRAPATPISSGTGGLAYAYPLLEERRPSAPTESQRFTTRGHRPLWAREAQPRFYHEGLEVPLPNHLPNRRRAQHPNTYAPPEGTSLGEPAQGLKEGGKQAHDLTEPGLHRPETDREDALLPFRPER